MTALAHENEETLEAPETGLLYRHFAADITPGTGRTVDVCIVPYGEQIEHNDGTGGVPKGVMFREEYVEGAFAHQVNAANRVLANVEHQQGIAGVVGHGVGLMERHDGFYGSFKIHDTPEGEKALMLIKEGVFDSVSLEARPRKSQRTPSGVIRRTKVDLINIAFSRWGAYKKAGVIALREPPQEIEILDEELLPLDIKPELMERCRALGIELPQRYQAHPDDTDTSASADTSDGTRQTVETTDTTEES